MPYDSFGQGVSPEELRKEQEYVEKHSKRIAVANATLPLIGVGFNVAGVISVGAGLVGLIASGEMPKVAGGVAGFALILGGAVFGLVESRIEF